MTPTAERIAQEALRLSHDEKVELAERLLLSLDPAEMAEIEREWGELAEARLDAYKAGKATAIPVEDVFARIWGRILIPFSHFDDARARIRPHDAAGSSNG